MLRELTIAASIFLSSWTFANADDNIEIVPAKVITAFVKDAFSSLYALPRKDDVIELAHGIFSNDDAFQAFVDENFQVPNSVIAMIDGLTASYTFAEKNNTFSITTDRPGLVKIGFHSVQNLTFNGKEVRKTCFEIQSDVKIPFGLGSTAGAKIQTMNVAMVPMTQCLSLIAQ